MIRQFAYRLHELSLFQSLTHNQNLNGPRSNERDRSNSCESDKYGENATEKGKFVDLLKPNRRHRDKGHVEPIRERPLFDHRIPDRTYSHQSEKEKVGYEEFPPGRTRF